MASQPRTAPGATPGKKVKAHLGSWAQQDQCREFPSCATTGSLAFSQTEMCCQCIPGECNLPPKERAAFKEIWKTPHPTAARQSRCARSSPRREQTRGGQLTRGWCGLASAL